jgi:hypothetical protein
MNGTAKTAEYGRRLDGAWCRLYAQASAAPTHPEEGSLEQFITEQLGLFRQGCRGGP